MEKTEKPSDAATESRKSKKWDMFNDLWTPKERDKAWEMWQLMKCWMLEERAHIDVSEQEAEQVALMFSHSLYRII